MIFTETSPSPRLGRDHWASDPYSLLVAGGQEEVPSVAGYGMVWYGMVWYGLMVDGMVWYEAGKHCPTELNVRKNGPK